MYGLGLDEVAVGETLPVTARPGGKIRVEGVSPREYGGGDSRFSSEPSELCAVLVKPRAVSGVGGICVGEEASERTSSMRSIAILRLMPDGSWQMAGGWFTGSADEDRFVRRLG